MLRANRPHNLRGLFVERRKILFACSSGKNAIRPGILNTLGLYPAGRAFGAAGGEVLQVFVSHTGHPSACLEALLAAAGQANPGFVYTQYCGLESVENSVSSASAGWLRQSTPPGEILAAPPAWPKACSIAGSPDRAGLVE